MNEKLSFIWKFLANPGTRFYYNSVHGKYRDLSDEEFIKRMFKARIGKELNLASPKSFNEKLQWLKLYNRNMLYPTLADKYEVKKYIAEKIGQEYVIPTIRMWESLDDIDINDLPSQFVLKCTHDSGGVIKCTDKSSFDFESAKKILGDRLARNFYWGDREWLYKDIEPRIIAEEYKEDNETKELRDYKFFCFGGKVRCFKIDFDRDTNHRANYYNAEGELIHQGEVVCPPDYAKKLEIPQNLSEMIELAEKLSQNIPFVRVDLYDVDNQIYFGEMTFFPAGGFGRFISDEFDYQMGDWLELPNKKIQ